MLSKLVTGQCTGGTYWTTINPNLTWQLSSCTWGGEYMEFQANYEYTYTISLCGYAGSSSSFDSQITILDNNGNFAPGLTGGGTPYFSNNYCGSQPHLSWTCPSTGTYRILVTGPNCQQINSCAYVAYLQGMPGDYCQSNEVLQGNDGSVSYNTALYDNANSGSCGGNGREQIYRIAVSSCQTITFWTTGDNYDVVLYARENSCTGQEVACVDDPDGYQLSYSNNTSTSEWLYIFLDGYGNYQSGSATLNWQKTSGSPDAPPNPTSNSLQCGNVTITRSGSPPSGVTWYWQTSCNGTSTSNSGSTYTATSSGTYYLRARTNSGNCWSSGCGSVSVTVNASPSNPPNPTSNSPQCGNVILTRSGNPPSGVTWYWHTGSIE